MKKIVLFCLTALLSISAWAFEADNGEGVTLSYEIVEVDGYDYACEVTEGDYWDCEEINIPETAYNASDGNTYTVIGIGEAAFYGCETLTSVTFPSTLIYINEYAFGEAGLTSLTLPKSIVYFGEGVFYACKGLSTLTLEEGITYLSDDMFDECESLEEISLPSTLTSIGTYTFVHCYALSEIELPNSITSIGDYAFQYCYSLESINIPKSVTNLGKYIFSSCSSLSDVTLEEGLTYISEGMFIGCSSLTSIDFLPSTITTIGEYAFSAGNLTSINLPENCKTIGDYAFYNNLYVSELTLPEGLEYIGDDAFYQNFYYMTGEVVLTIPESVTYLGSYAFYHCTNLKEVNILANIDTIHASTFYQNTSLTTVSIPKTVANIGNSAFYNCTALASITCLNREAPICGTNVFRSVPTSTCILYVPEGSEDAYANAPIWGTFTNIVGIEVDDDPDEEETKFVEDGIYYQYVDKDALTVEVTYESTSFNYYTGSITIPATVTHEEEEYSIIGIGENAFRSSPDLTSVSIPESITYLGEYAFYDCISLIEIAFPSSLSEISAYAFYGCTSLASLDFPNNITTIDRYAFCGCADLIELTIPATITAIGSNAFQNCTQLSTITFEDGEDELLFNDYAIFTSSSLTSVYLGRNLNYDDSSISHGIFYDYTNLKDITISESVTTLGYQLFYNTAIETITLPKTITDIGDFAFASCSQLKTVIISEGMTTLGRRMFNSCTALTNIRLPEGLINMGSDAFRDCTALEEVAIPSTVTSAEGAFYGCTKLKKVRLPEGVAEISNNMFNSCTSLMEIDLPSSIGNVGSYAFEYCTNLERVTFMEGESSYYIGVYAFSRCTSLTSILLPSNVRYIGSSGFNNCTRLKKVVFPNQTKSNSSLCFANGSSLEEVILCSQANGIYQYVPAEQFSGCTSLSKLYMLSTEAPDVYRANAFANVPTETRTLYVPVGSKEKYANDTYWSVFANIVELSNPLPVTYCVGNVTTESAQINGLVAVGSIDVTEVGFEYWAEGDDTPTAIVISDSFTATDELHATLADLAYGMTYTYRVYAKTASETFYGDEVTFTLPIDGAKVFTLDASSITETTAVLNGRLVLPDDESVAEQGFEYWAESGETQSVTVSGNSLTYTLENLTPETTYTYYAFATLASGSTIYGDEVEFTTLEATETGITDVEANGLDDENIEGYYTPDGRAIGAPQRGVNIIRYNDGTTKKVLIK